MEKREFKAESKRLLDLMINSIYTNKEIFLREIISNASDAIDKLYYKALSENIQGISREDFNIRIAVDETARTLTISDNGIGMSLEELEENLGTIAKSGSLNFKTENEAKEEIDIIGQFGVGFYSAFMVCDNIVVLSKAYGAEKAYKWVSDGADGYTVEECDKTSQGTDIVLTIKEDTEDDKYSAYIKEYQIRSLIRKYSDYIRYPIIMNVEKHRPIEATKEEMEAEDYHQEYESYFEDETLNSMIPIWRKAKKDVSEDDYNEFYKEKFYDYQNPLKVIHNNIEGSLNYNALLYIPATTPHNFYTKDYEKGLQLYSSGVLIMEKCADLLPDYLGFVRGLIDSQDLSLNISRELLQQDRQLKLIATRVEKKIFAELSDMLATDRDKYKDFFKNFGLQIKYGVYSNYGQDKDKLKDYVLLYSSKNEDYITLKEYVEQMDSEQKNIYFASGESIDKIAKTPQLEVLQDKGYDVLFLTDDVDEFMLRMLDTYDDKSFKNVSESDLGFEQSEEEKKEQEKKLSDNKALLEKIKDVLGERVSDVAISTRLKNNAVCFATKEGLSIEMEKVLNAMPNAQKIKAEKILEINPDHNVFNSLKRHFEENENSEIIEKYAKLLYNQALLIEGLAPEDVMEFTSLVSELMN